MWRETKHKHRPCPCGCGELADECMKPSSGLNAFKITNPDPTCVCCKKTWPKPTAFVTSGPIHFDCWLEHHSDPHASHGCRAED
jgi:hypothetical protein